MSSFRTSEIVFQGCFFAKKDNPTEVKHSPKRILILSAVLASVLFLSMSSGRTDHGCAARAGTEDLTVAEGEFFVGSGLCVGCHNTSIDGEDQVDADGNDVAVIPDWMGTMMANSARDPFWKAKVSHETLTHPEFAAEIEETCTRCHAPMGHYELEMTTGEDFLMSHLEDSELGQDGVGCLGCHAIDDVPELGHQFTGTITYTEDHLAFGGFEAPWDGLMSGQTGFNPVHSPHVRDSELCASCHSLFTHTFEDGAPTLNTFFEQATYHEWLNSSYPAENTECQSCHMPEVEGGAIAASNPLWLFPQTPYARHHLVGGNTYMLKLFQEYNDALNLAATNEQLAMVEQRTRDQLQQQTLELDLTKIDHVADTLELELDLWNKAGHKFPSGYPSRIAWVEMRIEDTEGNVLFEQGGMDSEFEILGRDLPYEAHHDVIRAEDEVQIYEMVMADANDLETTTLVNAAYPLKDNRLVPVGFSASHISYDTTLVAGGALLDPNFNNYDGSEGSGSDRLTFRIALNGYEGELVAEASVWYQSLPPRWMEDMFSETSDAIDSFKAMYTSVDPEPELIAHVVLSTTTAIASPEATDVRLYPNPVQNGSFMVHSPEVLDRIEVYTQSGELLTRQPAKNRVERVWLPEVAPGTYVVVMTSENQRWVQRIVVL